MHTRQVYDANNQLTGQQWTVGDKTYSQVFTYSKTEGNLTNVTLKEGNTTMDSFALSYDALRRLSKVDTSLLDRYYTYRDISDTQTTGQVSSYQYKIGSGNPLYSYGYTYDELGNIATYTEGGTTYTYTYDIQSQLLSQAGGGKTYTYTYDSAGNILTTSDGTTTHTYKYGYDDLDGDGAEDNVWKDLLIRFDGESILYDTVGNPTSYYNGTRWTMDWQEGRRLISANGGGKTLTFTYDSDGLRLTKKVGNTTYNYFYAGGKLMRQTGGGNTLDFFYDESGHPYALKYNGTTYYYVTNLQGDVLHIVNNAGTAVVSYTYDPYGKPLTTTGSMASTLGADNPLRYRGYVYDSETGFYYLQSRYYDPTICRFINADSYASTGQGFLGYNMFAYCNNNPANMADSAGNLSQWIGDIWEEIKDFFSPDSNSISGEFEDGIFFGSGSLTGGYSEANGRLQVNSKNSKNNGMLGVFGKISTGNASGKIGIGNHNASLSLKGVGDGLTSTIQAGIQYKDGAGLAAKAKASVLSGRVTFELNLFGWQAEVGVSGDLLSVGAEAMVGVFPNEGFTAKASAGAGLFGAGFVIRIKPPQ